MTAQTKVESIIESSVNVFSGTIVSLIILTYIVSPLWGFETSWWDNIGITAIFTVSAVLRGYLWRRFFNKNLHKLVHRTIKGILWKTST